MNDEEKNAVIKIYTREYAIVGKIMISVDESNNQRLSDYLNRPDVDFIPIHEAHVFSLDTKKPISSKVFILLNKREIKWLVPIKEPANKISPDT